MCIQPELKLKLCDIEFMPAYISIVAMQWLEKQISISLALSSDVMCMWSTAEIPTFCGTRHPILNTRIDLCHHYWEVQNQRTESLLKNFPIKNPSPISDHPYNGNRLLLRRLNPSCSRYHVECQNTSECLH